MLRVRLTARALPPSMATSSPSTRSPTAAARSRRTSTTLLDGDSLDVLNALGANLSNAANTLKRTADGLLPVAASRLTLHVTNAGNAKGGRTIVYLR
jgi:hypothetical protein